MKQTAKANLHFALGMLVLLGASIGIQVAKAMGLLYIIKKPIPILKPLNDLDRGALAPYEVVELAPLSNEMLQELGTTEYINWVLREPGKGRQQGREITVSVTYYTDVQDQVPHVPEECWNQGGNFTPASDTKMTLRSDELNEDIAVRRLAFYPAGEMVKRNYVYYTICVNGKFCSDRNIVRLHMANRLDTHLYYSKVEIAFQDALEKNEPRLDEKARQLFDKVLPELMKSHWPPRGSERGGLKAAAAP
ncbi:MAG: exosortase-associated EpsI family protein [Planctomycetes bacterium]|nr:exosortase-associated EpsI family protein [Planctomycetota bacterium]